MSHFGIIRNDKMTFCNNKITFKHLALFLM